MMTQINYHYTQHAEPDSGAISDVYFDAEAHDAVVVFNGGGEYLYDDVTEEDFFDLVDADSPRTEWATNWKGAKLSERVDVLNYIDRDDVDADATSTFNETLNSLSGLLGRQEQVATSDSHGLRLLLGQDEPVEVNVNPGDVVSVPRFDSSANGHRAFEVVLLLDDVSSVEEALEAVREGDLYDVEVVSVRAV